MNKHHQWLAKQLPLWVKDNLISGEQAKQLQSHYPVDDSMGLGRLLITGIGAIMIGLGVILLFAYNWADMSKYLKLAVIFGSLISSHLLGMFVVGRNRLFGESLFALGTMLMGSAIFLVGQIYHLDSHYPTAILLWSAGALAMAWALPSLTQAFMAICLVILWHVTEVFNFHYANHAAFLVILFGIFPLVWRLHSPVLARFVSTGLLVTLGLSISSVDEGLVGITLLLISSAMIFADRIIQTRGNTTQTDIANEMAKPAVLVLVLILFGLTFSDFLREMFRIKLEDPLTSGIFWVALIVSQLAFGWLLFKRKINAITLLAELTVILVFLPTLLTRHLEYASFQNLHVMLSIAFNLILLGMSIWLMTDGARHGNRRRMVGGSILFAILAMARYTDLFDSLIARAVVFLIVGITLFVAGNIYQRNKQEALT